MADGEADALAVRTGAAVAQLHALHLDRPDPGLDRALRPMAVPDQALAPIRQLHAFHGGQECFGLRLDSLRQQPARAVPQDCCQWIIDLVRLTQGNRGGRANSNTAISGLSA